jgi:hypothetical protein
LLGRVSSMPPCTSTRVPPIVTATLSDHFFSVTM